MDFSRKEKIFSEINRLLLEENLSTDELMPMIESMVKHHLDNIDDIEEIDMFQDRLNDMIDDYVEQHFEDTMEDNYN